VVTAPALPVVTPLREALAPTPVIVLVAVAGWFVVTWIGHRFVQRVRRQADRDGSIAANERARRIGTVWTMLRNIFTAVLAVSVILVLLTIWGIPTTPLIAIGSALGVAVGFGAQGFVRDVIAGLLIIGEGQYAIGDRVQIAGVTGVVETIKLRTTILREIDGNVHHVPNGLVLVATNLTRDYGQVIIDMAISNETDLARATALLEDEARLFAEDPDWGPVVLAAPEMLGVEELGSSSVKLRLALKVEPNSKWDARRELLRRIKVRFDDEGVAPPASG
jgi:small conductance mechanosensitive channel